MIVVGATAGVEVGTERVWEYCEARGLPRIFFVSMMDKEHANFDKIFEDIKTNLSPNVLPVEIPIGEGEDFHGIINLFSERAHLYKKGTTTGEYDEGDIPEELRAKFEQWETELQETLATTDESLLERYLEGGHISRDEVIDAMARMMARGEIFPLFCGSGRLTYGLQALLRKIVELCPSPLEAKAELATRAGLDQVVELKADDDGPFAALVFKTTTEPHVGELSFFKVMSGQVENGAEAVNASDQKSEKLGHLSISLGKERYEVPPPSRGATSASLPSSSTPTPTTRSAQRIGCSSSRRSISPSQTSRSRSAARPGTTTTSWERCCPGSTKKIRPSLLSSTPSCTRRSRGVWGRCTSRFS